ncbi:unnamed protein product [Eruca vesicaria subsp. sativa]|uniref:RING-type E3 ubiquitin transferase n=1 Tax=Eruca vesicaria subsp. sativa TaxID=29727 RepID=A0ABC8JR20_ERUVS|nr:unnamed protein product [Eruca vesicaria subsp. sativa]
MSKKSCNKRVTPPWKWISIYLNHMIFALSKQEFQSSSSSLSTSANRGCSPLLSRVIPSGFGLAKKVKTEERRLVFNPRGSVSDSRRARHCILNVDSQRSVNRGNSRMRFSNRWNGRDGLSSITTTEMSQTETSNNLNSPVFLELFSGFPEFGLSDSVRSYTLDGISEILPELDRMEQDIELNYEELLALEERIGTVSSTLTEEAISKSMKTSIYQKKPSSFGSINNIRCAHKEDAKCNICQEEYTIGDEVGRLHCSTHTI